MQYLKLRLTDKSIDGAGIFSGYASVFNVVDHDNDCVLQGAFEIDESDAGAKKPKLLWQHDPHEVIGVWTELKQDAYGLYVCGKLEFASARGKEAYALMKTGALDALSVGIEIIDSEVRQKDGVRLIKKANLIEISLVTFACNQNAKILNIKSKQKQRFQEKQIQEESQKMNCEKLALKNFVRNGVVTKGLSSQTASGAMMIQNSEFAGVQRKTAGASIRSLCATETIGSGSFEILTEKGLGAAGWTSEIDERDETDLPELVKVCIPTHELYAKPRVSQKLLDDADVDVEAWVLQKIEEKMVSLENDAFLNGDGEGKPKGVLSYSTSKSDSTHGTLGSVMASDLTAESLIQLMNALKTEYLDGAVWVMNRATLANIRLLKDSNGQFLLQSAFNDGFKMQLLGHDVVLNDAMPGCEATQKPIVFGNFKRGYQIVDRQEIELMRDPYSTKPFVEFYATKRVGGDIVDFDAFKVIEITE